MSMQRRLDWSTALHGLQTPPPDPLPDWINRLRLMPQPISNAEVKRIPANVIARLLRQEILRPTGQGFTFHEPDEEPGP